jgi:hypothetical protein
MMHDDPFAGMTVNERLVISGHFEAFATAAGRRDRAGMIAVLEAAGLRPEQAAATADATLKDPGRYGY